MADRVEPFAYKSDPPESWLDPKQVLKYLFVKMLQPVFKALTKRQMIFNEYVWLLANTVAAQNERITALEEQLEKRK